MICPVNAVNERIVSGRISYFETTINLSHGSLIHARDSIDASYVITFPHATHRYDDSRKQFKIIIIS